MILRKMIVFFSVLIVSCSSQLVDVEKVDQDRVITKADNFLNEKPITVTAFQSERSAGGIHDFYSEGDYWWPNPEKPDGPYIRRDGLTNPDNFVEHRLAMRRLSIIVPTLVAAFKLTGDVKYANAALYHLQAWFINEETLMNPHMKYSQAIMGKVEGRGIGIIDTIHLVEVAQAVIVLEKLGYLKTKDSFAIKKWFSNYNEWLMKSDFGKDERDNGNNHSTCWVMQVGSYSKLTNNLQAMDYCRDFYKNHIVPEQVAVDGSFPKELARTKPYGYSLFNLDAMAAVCQILTTEKENLWEYKTNDGRGMEKAMEFMYPYITDKLKWNYDPDVMYYDEWPVRHPSLLFAGLAYQNKKYIETWKTLDPDPDVPEVIRNYPIRQPILWVN